MATHSHQKTARVISGQIRSSSNATSPKELYGMRQQTLFELDQLDPALKQRRTRPARSKRRRQITTAEPEQLKGRPATAVDLKKEQTIIAAARDAICRVFRVLPKIIAEHSKREECNVPRQAFFYLLYHVGVMSERRIAAGSLPMAYTKNTVNNALRTVRDVMRVDDGYKAKILKAMRIMINYLRREVKHG